VIVGTCAKYNPCNFTYIKPHLNTQQSEQFFHTVLQTDPGPSKKQVCASSSSEYYKFDRLKYAYNINTTTIYTFRH